MFSLSGRSGRVAPARSVPAATPSKAPPGPRVRAARGHRCRPRSPRAGGGTLRPWCGPQDGARRSHGRVRLRPWRLLTLGGTMAEVASTRSTVRLTCCNAGPTSVSRRKTRLGTCPTARKRVERGLEPGHSAMPGGPAAHARQQFQARGGSAHRSITRAAASKLPWASTSRLFANRSLDRFQPRRDDVGSRLGQRPSAEAYDALAGQHDVASFHPTAGRSRRQQAQNRPCCIKYGRAHRPRWLGWAWPSCPRSWR